MYGQEFTAALINRGKEFAGDLLLQMLDLLGAELHHMAVAQVDEMVVMLVRHRLVARAAIAKIVAAMMPGILEQLHRAA